MRGQAGGGLIGSKSYNLQRRDSEPIKTVGSDLVNKLCKSGETYPSLIEREPRQHNQNKNSPDWTKTNRGKMTILLVLLHGIFSPG